MSNTTLTPEEIINKHLSPMWGSLEFAAIDYFKETGTINASFLQRLKEMLKEHGDQRYEEGKADAQAWIPVEERLPEKPGLKGYEHVECWCYVPKIGVIKLAWNCEHECWDREDFDDVSSYNSRVTHWIYCVIPSPPKEQ